MSKTLIIAEAGVNHNGSIDLAKKLVDKADYAGADYVKFQAFRSELLVSKVAEKAPYQKQATDEGETQLEMLKKLELSYEDHKQLIEYCRSKQVKFLSSAFDLESLDFIGQLNLDLFKIPSGEINNLPYLKKVGAYDQKVVLSTGMADMREIHSAMNVLIQSGTSPKNITVLHCNTEYPTPFGDVNLNAMMTIRDELKVDVGYSDHTLGIEIPIAAVAMGASVIEKHFTLDNTMEGPDHSSSLEPEGLKEMIRCIRNIEVALGSGIKEASSSELTNKFKVRKSIHVVRDLSAGHQLVEGDLIMQRPGDGISPMELDSVIGCALKVSLMKGNKLSYEHIEN